MCPCNHVFLQVRLCLAKKDYIRAQILARKISPRAFQLKKGEAKGEIGIEGTAIEAADEVGELGCVCVFACSAQTCAAAVVSAPVQLQWCVACHALSTEASPCCLASSTLLPLPTHGSSPAHPGPPLPPPLGKLAPPPPPPHTHQGIPSLPELKQRYYQMMVTYHLHYNNYLEVCRSYRAMYEDEEVQGDPARWMPVRAVGQAGGCGCVCGKHGAQRSCVIQG
jgi:hypothetical protein